MRSLALNVVYAVHHLPPRYLGGAENRALRTAHWMHAHGHATGLICVEAIDQSAPPFFDSREHGLPIRRLSFDHRRFADPRRWQYDNAFVEAQVAGFLAERRPDIFHLISGYLMTAGAIRAARAAGARIVVTLTDFWFLCPRITLQRSNGALCPRPPQDPLGCARCLAEEQRRYRLPTQAAPRLADALWPTLGRLWPETRGLRRHVQDRRAVLREAMDQVDVFICPSQYIHDLYQAEGLPAERLRVIRQGLSLPGALPRRDAARQPFVIGYSGQLKAHKGVDLLIEAAHRLAAHGRRFTLALYGKAEDDPAYAARLQSLLRGADWVEWRGSYAPPQTWAVMTGLDALVVPSRWYENSPNVILEAQACRTPVVATDLGGMAELVRHDVNGLLFPLNDAAGLARALDRLLTEPELWRRLHDNAPPVKTLDMEMAKLQALYTELTPPGVL